MSLSLIAALAAITLAPAGGSATSHQIVYNEVALETLNGTRGLYRDLRQDARRICVTEGYANAKNVSTERCVAHVLQISVDRIGDKTLSSIHKSQSN